MPAGGAIVPPSDGTRRARPRRREAGHALDSGRSGQHRGRPRRRGLPRDARRRRPANRHRRLRHPPPAELVHGNRFPLAARWRRRRVRPTGRLGRRGPRPRGLVFRGGEAGGHGGRRDGGRPADLDRSAREPVPAHARGPVPGRHPVSLRLRGRGQRPVLLPRRSEGLHRPRVLRRAAAAVRRAGRLRAGLRARARGGPSRPDAARRSRSGCGVRQAGNASQRQRALGAARAAGGLPGRRVGARGSAAGRAAQGRSSSSRATSRRG